MKAEKMKIIVATIVLAMQLFAQSNPGMEMQEAIKKEQVDGDLKTAIAIYQKIAADSSAPRDLRAKALLHQARCYEKLGQQAQTVYRQIVRDFGDQPEAVQAKARLAALSEADRPTAPVGMTQRKIEVPTSSFILGPQGTDGNHVVYQNHLTGELIYSDLAGKSKRVIFKAKLDDSGYWYSVPSKNFSMVFLVLIGNNQHQTYAIVNADGTHYRELAQLDGSQYINAAWSWDNRYILVCRQTPDGATHLDKLSVADGRIRELLSLKTGEVITPGEVPKAQFSPDGRFVAYQNGLRIFILPAEGGEPQPIYEERQSARIAINSRLLKFLDWTADGRFLAIASERTGKGALHLLPVSNGKSAGAPVFVKYGDFEDGTTLASGALVYLSVKPGGTWAVYLASLDPNGRPGDWKRLALHLGNTDNPSPKLSRDGNQIVYVAEGQDTGENGGQVVHLHNLSTGEDREIYHAFGRVFCAWAVQQLKLFCSDAAEKTDILSIAIESGEISRLHTFPAPRHVWVYRSINDQTFYMYSFPVGGGRELLRWEMASGEETILDHFPSLSYDLLSSDERTLIRSADQNLDIRPTSGGEWKSVGSIAEDFAMGLGQFNITPDGKWLVYHDVDSKGKDCLSRVAITGGPPERLGNFPTQNARMGPPLASGSLEISPDGGKVIVSNDDPFTGYELWQLENFVPPAPKP